MYADVYVCVCVRVDSMIIYSVGARVPVNIIEHVPPRLLVKGKDSRYVCHIITYYYYENIIRNNSHLCCYIVQKFQIRIIALIRREEKTGRGRGDLITINYLCYRVCGCWHLCRLM